MQSLNKRGHKADYDRTRQRQGQRAHYAAMRRLQEAHSEEWEHLLMEEREHQALLNGIGEALRATGDVLSVEMDLFREHKTTARFNAQEDGVVPAALANVYVPYWALREIGYSKGDSIKVTIEVARRG